MGVNGFDGDTKARLQAERSPSPKTGEKTTTADYAFAAPSLN